MRESPMLRVVTWRTIVHLRPVPPLLLWIAGRIKTCLVRWSASQALWWRYPRLLRRLPSEVSRWGWHVLLAVDQGLHLKNVLLGMSVSCLVGVRMMRIQVIVHSSGMKTMAPQVRCAGLTALPWLDCRAIVANGATQPAFPRPCFGSGGMNLRRWH